MGERDVDGFRETIGRVDGFLDGRFVGVFVRFDGFFVGLGFDGLIVGGLGRFRDGLRVGRFPDGLRVGRREGLLLGDLVGTPIIIVLQNSE